MKKLILLLSLSIYFQSAYSRVLTVSNSSTSIAQYSNLQTAIDASKYGDTIYVHGSKTTYGDITIKRRITLIGAGFNPIETQTQFPTTIQTINLDSSSIGGFGGTGDTIAGVKLSSISAYQLTTRNSGLKSQNNITIERCKITYLSISGSHWLITNCWITASLNIGNWFEILIANNFLTSINTSDEQTVVFTNNIFLPNGGATGSGITNALFTNNIFFNNNPTTNGISRSTFNNNIIGNKTPLSAVTSVNNNFGAVTSNINNTAAPFTKGFTEDINNVTDLARYDFTLKATSTINTKGTDGTEIGVYGGSYKLYSINITGASALPQIIRMDLFNSVLPKTDKLKVSFKARKVN